MNKYIPVFFFAFVCLMSAQNSHACTCIVVDKNASLEEKVGAEKNSASAVFSGTVLKIERISDSRNSVTFDVERLWKGIDSPEIKVLTGNRGGDCGYVFEVNIAYLVYAFGSDDGELGTTICSRTSPVSEAPDDIGILDEIP